MTCTIDHDAEDALPRCLCRWCSPRPVDLMTPEERVAHYASKPVTDLYRGGNEDDHYKRDRETRAEIERQRKEKRDAARERMLARHAAAGEVYDRRHRRWVGGGGGPSGANTGAAGLLDDD
jgi:hypothetical protein